VGWRVVARIDWAAGGATLVDGMVEEVAVVEAVEWAAAEVPNIREVFDTKLLGLGLRRLYA
jgi:hypothetical protein